MPMRLAVQRSAWPHTVCRAVVGAELEEFGAVDDARDHLAHVDRLAKSSGITPASWSAGVAGGLGKGRRVGVAPAGRARTPAAAAIFARDAHRVRIVLGQVLAQPRDRRVHLGPAEFLVGRDLAGGARSSGGPARKALARPRTMITWSDRPGMYAPPAVDEPCTIATTGMPAADSRARLQKSRPPFDEALDPVLQQVGAGRLDQLHEGQLVLQRDLLPAAACRGPCAGSRRRRCRRR
jgi:hypothetical protein